MTLESFFPPPSSFFFNINLPLNIRFAPAYLPALPVRWVSLHMNRAKLHLSRESSRDEHANTLTISPSITHSASQSRSKQARKQAAPHQIPFPSTSTSISISRHCAALRCSALKPPHHPSHTRSPKPEPEPRVAEGDRGKMSHQKRGK